MYSLIRVPVLQFRFSLILSGYFYARKIKSGSEVTPTTINLLKRLGAIWLFFTIIYILPYDFFSAFEYGVIGPAKVIYLNLRKIVNDPVAFIFEGSKVHLWFLVSLSLSVLITSLFLLYWPKNPLPPLIIFSMALYVVGLLARPYSMTPIGIDIHFNTRRGPFFSTVFFVLGYVLSYFEFTPKHFIFWEIGCVFIVFLLSVSVTLVISKNERLRKVFV